MVFKPLKMRRSQLKSTESSTDTIETITSNQLLNNSLNIADFNQTILRLNESEMFEMSQKSTNDHNSNNNELSDSDNLDENDSFPFDILIHDHKKILNESDNVPVKLSNGLKKDLNHIIFLLFLYFLQGIPLGLTGALPFILQSSPRKVSYSDQGTFSFAFYPFSLKLLWAPIVDSLYFKNFGRRKSWLVPMQYLIGIFLFMFADYVNDLLEGNVNTEYNSIYVLTAIFFVITFFTATQDIAVDGWALEILSKENISWASTCNTAGQSAGWFVGNVIFLVFQSTDFSNKYFRRYVGLNEQNYGIMQIHYFMKFFGIVFLITTTLILLFKKEIPTNPSDNQDQLEDHLTVKKTYEILWNIFKLSSVKKLAIVLLTSRIAFGLHSVAYLKLIEKGVPRENLGLLALPLTPLEIALPILISRYTNGPNPLRIFIKSYPYRLFGSFLIVTWVYLTTSFRDSTTNSYPFYYYIICLLLNAFYSTFSTFMSVAQMAFFTKISDKKIGGTYMTLLTTISNIGSNWPQTLSLYLVDFFSINNCIYDSNMNVTITDSFSNVLEKMEKNSCDTEFEKNACKELGGKCLVNLDAYYLIAIGCGVFGILWILYNKTHIWFLETLPKSSWKIRIKS